MKAKAVSGVSFFSFYWLCAEFQWRDVTLVYVWRPDPGRPAWNDARLPLRTAKSAVPSSDWNENSCWCPGHSASSHSPSLCQKPGGVHRNRFTGFKYLYRFPFNRLLLVCITSSVASHHTYQPLIKQRLMITLGQLSTFKRNGKMLCLCFSLTNVYCTLRTGRFWTKSMTASLVEGSLYWPLGLFLSLHTLASIMFGAIPRRVNNSWNEWNVCM